MKTLKKYWWLLALRGLFGIIIGIFAIVWPGVTFSVFLIILAVYLLVEGILAVLTGLISIGKGWHWLALLLEGAVAIIAGWVIITTPGIAVLTLAIFVQVLAIWLMLGGILRIALAFGVREKIKNEVFLILSGILSVLVGFWIFVQPALGIIALVWLFGFTAVLMGIFFVAFAIQLKENKV